MSQQKHQADAERRRRFRNPDDQELSQERHQAEAERLRQFRIPGKLARAEETEEEALDRMQRQFEERTERQRTHQKACHASNIFK